MIIQLYKSNSRSVFVFLITVYIVQLYGYLELSRVSLLSIFSN